MFGMGYGGGGFQGDRLGNLLLLFGLITLFIGIRMLIPSFHSWRDAFNKSSADMSQYTMWIGGVAGVLGIGMCVYGYIRMVSWFSDYSESWFNASKLVRERENGTIITVLGRELEFPLGIYTDAFEYGGILSYALALVALGGLYITWGSIAALMRRNFLITGWKPHVIGAFYGIGIFIFALIMGFRWLTFVARAMY